MAGRWAGASPTTSAEGTAAVAGPAERPGRARWLALVVLFDHVAAVCSFTAAGAYLILKVLNDNHSVLYPVIDEAARWFYYLELHEMPGLPDYPALRTFVIPDFAFTYLIAMGALHLLAAAGFVALARGLGRSPALGAPAHIALAALAVLVLGGYAYAYSRSTAPPIGLAVLVGAALVPVGALAILLTPGIAAPLASGPGPDGAVAPRLDLSRARLPRLVLGVLLVADVVGAIATIWIISIPVAINLRMIQGGG